VAQTKRKRRTKHRGNAAGVVEARGRTGRKPTAAEAKASGRDRSRQERMERLNKPPTWRGAVNRAGIATVIFAIALVLLFKENIGATIGLAGFIFLMYIPLGYYTDQFIYKRRQAKGLAPKPKPKDEK
jgi:Flp pilus assembly protein TadB